MWLVAQRWYVQPGTERQLYLVGCGVHLVHATTPTMFNDETGFAR